MLRNGLIGAIALIVLSIGAVGMSVLAGLREPPQRQVVDDLGPLVRVVSVQPQDVPLTVTGFGTVRAKHLWSVVPEVSGAVVRLSPNMRAGLAVRQGELLFEIDPRPYQIAVRRIRAHLHRHAKEIAVLTQQRENQIDTLQLARTDLAIAENDLRRDEELARRGTISTRERNRRRQIRNEVMQAVQNAEHLLALSGPQIEQAEAAVAVARADLQGAELNLSKTRLLAPFDGHDAGLGRIRHRRAGSGRPVQPGSRANSGWCAAGRITLAADAGPGTFCPCLPCRSPAGRFAAGSHGSLARRRTRLYVAR